MNVAALLAHTCDIVHKNAPVTDNNNRDAYRQPRNTPKVIFTEVPCQFTANVSRSLFTVDVLRSAGSVLASFLIDGDTVGEDTIRLGDVITNVNDKRGNLVTNREWFVFRIMRYTDSMGMVYYRADCAYDEAGPRN